VRGIAWPVKGKPEAKAPSHSLSFRRAEALRSLRRDERLVQFIRFVGMMGICAVNLLTCVVDVEHARAGYSLPCSFVPSS
jgi:hypothetical protein